MRNQLCKLVCCLFLLLPAWVVFADDGGEQKAILITGASTGIGRNLAEALAAEGHFVYAGARKQADLDELNAIENIQAIRLDVTIQEQIDAAVETVSKGGRGLYGLVNNAGVVVTGSMIEVDEDDMQFISRCSEMISFDAPNAGKLPNTVRRKTEVAD